MTFTKVLDMHVHVMHHVPMTLDEYLTKAKMTDAAFAEKVNVGRSMVTKLRHRIAKPSFDTARQIEKATDGKVSLKDLEPLKKIGDAKTAPAVAAQ